MVHVFVFSESRFLVKRKVLKKEVESFLAEEGIKSDVEVSIAIVGDRKMRELNKKYRNLDQVTPVLSFSQTEGKPFVKAPNGVLRLGDIVISYPQTVELAASENKLVDQKISELARHGLANLLRIL